jgi:FkbM family methyltransferase
MKQAIRSFLVGGRAAQPLFRAMHQVALIGRNYGNGDLTSSGEFVALRYVKPRITSTPVIFDVGANYGEWALRAAASWPDARIHAFEPAEAIYNALGERVGHLPEISIHRTALGARAETLTLHKVPGSPGLSSLHHRDLRVHGIDMTQSEQVAVTTLDEFCAKESISQIDFLKIDAEGHDLAVLQGGADMLSRGDIRFIQFEFGGANIDSRSFLRDFVRLLESTHRLFRLLPNGMEPLRYHEREEIFRTANYLAVPNGAE